MLGLILAVSMFPQISVVSPLYLLLRSLQLINTYPGLVLPYLTFAMPLTVWLLVGFFRQLPAELEEAAMVDGASRLRTFREVVVPLALPGLATTAILTFVYSWNEFLFALSFTLGPGAADRAGGHRAVPRAVPGALGSDPRRRDRGDGAGGAAGARVPAADRPGTHGRSGERVSHGIGDARGHREDLSQRPCRRPRSRISQIADGEFMVLVGPSGCGKSTALRIIAGLETPTAGRVLIGEQDVTGLPPQERDIAMVFQSYALYPHMTVRQNLGFGLRMRGAEPAVIAERVVKAAQALLLDQVLDRKPGQLSGGQRQRVALGRAMVREPQAFLFDEPLSNLDAKLRVETRAELARLHRRLAATIVYVTHDQEEALTLGEPGGGAARRRGGAGGAADGALSPPGDALRRAGSSGVRR